jgi:hypothetical protein
MTVTKLTVKEKQVINENSFLILVESLREMRLNDPDTDFFNFVDFLDNCKEAFLNVRADVNEASINNVVGALLTARYRKQDPDKQLLVRQRLGRSNAAGGNYRYNINLEVYESIYGNNLK